jgi:hypothetical protein
LIARSFANLHGTARPSPDEICLLITTKNLHVTKNLAIFDRCHNNYRAAGLLRHSELDPERKIGLQ